MLFMTNLFKIFSEYLTEEDVKGVRDYKIREGQFVL
jgi:hypothetical protein